LPALTGSSGGSNEFSDFSEREILYKVLFDMKKDMNDLKKMVLKHSNQEASIPIS
jgi:hypothetical protein